MLKWFVGLIDLEHHIARDRKAISVLMIRAEIYPDIHYLYSANSMKFPLIMYSKFVWSNLIWPDRCLFLAGKCLVTGHYHKSCIWALKRLPAAHAFNYIVLRVNPGLTSCENLATALDVVMCDTQENCIMIYTLHRNFYHVKF